MTAYCQYGGPAELTAARNGPWLCSAVDKLNSDRLYYGALLDSKRLLAMGTDHDRGHTKDFSDRGDISVGCVDAAQLEKVQGELPACDGTLLNGWGARILEQMQGLPHDRLPVVTAPLHPRGRGKLWAR